MATVIFYTSGTSLTIPADYDSANNTWEAIGGGGGASFCSGAGGGEYRKIVNQTYTPSATRTIQIGAGGVGSTTNSSAGGNGTFTQLLQNDNSTVALKANGANGVAYGATTGSAGGTGGTGAGGNANGGAGGNATGAAGGGGGGGAGGPSGVGGSGGATSSSTQFGGACGGGGSNGGSTPSTISGSNPAPSAGGNGQGGTGGGSAGTGNNTASPTAGGAGTAGTGAGGGGGATGSGTTVCAPGGAGAVGSIWTQTSDSATAGPGGGGGGGGGNGASAHSTQAGGNAGLYGGGGGGDGNFNTGTVKGGNGAQGILVLTYTPTAGGGTAAATVAPTMMPPPVPLTFAFARRAVVEQASIVSVVNAYVLDATTPASYSLTAPVATLLRHGWVVGQTTAGSYSLTVPVATLLRHGWKTPAGAVGANYTLTGATTTALTHQWRLVATTPSSYTLTGQVAKLSQALTATTAGSYSLTVPVATLLRHGWRLNTTASVGSYSLTVPVATLLRHGWALPAGVTSYALVGSTTTTLGLGFFAGVGSYSLTGQTTTLVRHGWVVNAQTASSYALTGQTAALTKTAAAKKIDATTPASYALTGQVAHLNQALVATTVGSYSLTVPVATLLRHGWRLPAGVTSYALTGTNVGLAKALTATTAGAYSMIGQVAHLNQGLIATTAGSYALTGQTVTLRKAWKLIATTASSYALTGQTARLAHGYNIVAGTASYTLTGTDVALVRPTTKIITALVGSYALTGQAARLAHGYNIVAGTASYTLTGQTVALTKGKFLPAGVASYALTGTATTLVTHQWRLTAGVGSYVLTPQTTLLRKGWRLPAGVTSYALTGTAAGVLHGWRVTAALSNYALTGINQTLTKGKVLATLAPASYLLSPGNVVGLAQKLTAGVASYALTGQPVTLRHGWRLAATTAGSYALTGAVTTLLWHGWRLAAGVGSYGLTGAAGTAGDTYWSNVVLLAGFNGANGATSFTDESPAAHGSITLSGTATLDTSRQQFGSASLGCGSAGGAVWGPSGDWAFGTGSFTVECWIYTTTASGAECIVTNFNGGSGVGSWLLRLNGSTLEWWGYSGGVVNDLSWSGVTANAWHHVAIDYDGTKYRLYYDGNCKATFSTGRNIPSNSEGLSVGMSTFGDQTFKGNVDEVRITKGTARYASDTTYTVPPTAFPRTAGSGTGAVLLLHGWKLNATTAGSYLLNGQPVALTKAAHNTIVVTPGSYALTGTDAGLLKTTPHILAAGAGSYTLTGAGAGAAATTWNASDKSASVTLSGGNLTATASASGDMAVRGTQSYSSGKYYFEITIGSTYSGGDTGFGVATSSAVLGSVGTNATGAILVYPSGATYVNGSFVTNTTGALSTGVVVGCAIDLDNKRAWFRVGTNVWNGSGTADPSTNVGGVDISSVFASNAAYPLQSFGPSASGSFSTANFGATALVNGPPSSFAAWGGTGSGPGAVLLRHGWKQVATTAGSYSLTGQPVSLKRTWKQIATTAGAYALTGQTTTLLRHGWVLAAGTLGGSVTTWNPSDKDAGISLSNGNLTAQNTNNAVSGVRAINSQTTGKLYFEMTCTTFVGTRNCVGLATLSYPRTSFGDSTSGVTGNAVVNKLGTVVIDGGTSYLVGGSGPTSINFGSIASGTVICVAVDLAAHLIWFRLGAGGNWNAVAGRDPATGIGGASIPNLGGSIAAYPIGAVNNTNDATTINFGATSFIGAVPSGFSAWNAAGTTYALTGQPITFTKNVVLAPSLFLDPDQFFTHNIKFNQFLTTGFFDDPDTFFPATVDLYYGDTEVMRVLVDLRDMKLEWEDREMVTEPGHGAMEVLDEDTLMAIPPQPRETDVDRGMEVVGEEGMMHADVRRRK